MDDDVRTVELATAGVAMPLLGFGTWQVTGRKGYEAIRTALEVGYRHIDTATMYGNESEVGRAIKDSGVPRDDIFVTTKLPAERAGREAETLAASLRALGVGAVDLWLIHWPPGGNRATSVWRALRSARDQGLARAIGVSNFSLDQLDELITDSGEAPAVNQIPWSPWEYSRSVVDGHAQRGVILEGYSPFKRSDLRSPVLAEIAQRHGVTPAQVVLRWHIDQSMVVIPKSVSPERIASNFDVFGFRLTPDEVGQVNALAG